MTWHSSEMKDSVQTFPSYEHDHVLGLNCWCGPEVTQEPDQRVPCVTHRDQLDRVGPEDPEHT